MNTQQWTSYLIGEGNLVRQCAALLHQDKWQLLGIITQDPPSQTWAASAGIPCWSNIVAWRKDREAFDYLFSIVNEHLLPESVLALARGGNINYHDSLLPRYAGVHATSWAIINDETSHGISWHWMEQGIDTGAILKQVPVPIRSNDTALTLNLRCYEAALASFADLLDGLADNTLTPLPQASQNRSYEGRHQKPPGNGFIDWTQSAAAIERQHRALDFGHHPNTLAITQVMLGQQIYVVNDLRVLSATQSTRVGQIIACDEARGIALKVEHFVEFWANKCHPILLAIVCFGSPV